MKVKRKQLQATPQDLEELPVEVREIISPHIITPEMLDNISTMIVTLRDEAKAARTASNVESCWIACEEAYVGIDDANRAEWAASKWSKPMSMDGPVVAGREQKTEDTKSTVFVRLTSRYVDAAASKLSEILLPVDDKPFSLNETPKPEL